MWREGDELLKNQATKCTLCPLQSQHKFYGLSLLRKNSSGDDYCNKFLSVFINPVAKTCSSDDIAIAVPNTSKPKMLIKVGLCRDSPSWKEILRLVVVATTLCLAVDPVQQKSNFIRELLLPMTNVYQKHSFE